MKLSHRVKKISPSLTLAIAARAKKMKQEGINVIDFGSGEPDFDTPSHIKDAAIKAIQQGFTKYTPVSGTEQLKKLICEKFLKENNLKYEPHQIVVSCGAKHSLYNTFQVLCDKQDEVIIPSPYWLSYPEMVKMADAKPVFIKTDEKNNFKISLAQLKDAITKKTKAVVINSPSNPTGCVYNRDELKELGDIATKKNIIIISDEIYEKIIFGNNRHTSIASIDEKIFKNTIVVNGVSKSFAMTGWRIGYLASCNDKVVSSIENLQSHSTSNPASISQAAAVEAIKEKDIGVEDMVRVFEKRRDYIVSRVDGIDGLSCVKPEGAFYVFCRIDRKTLSSVTLAERLLEEARVAVVSGRPFGSDKHIRLSFATSMENIREGMDRIERWFEKLYC